MADMRSIRRALRHILVAVAFVLSVSDVSAHAADLVANRSELIQRLLPTVVNITVRKEVAPPHRRATASASSGSASTKSYVGSGFVIDPSGADRDQLPRCRERVRDRGDLLRRHNSAGDAAAMRPGLPTSPWCRSSPTIR